GLDALSLSPSNSLQHTLSLSFSLSLSLSLSLSIQLSLTHSLSLSFSLSLSRHPSLSLSLSLSPPLSIPCLQIYSEKRSQYDTKSNQPKELVERAARNIARLLNSKREALEVRERERESERV